MQTIIITPCEIEVTEYHRRIKSTPEVDKDGLPIAPQKRQYEEKPAYRHTPVPFDLPPNLGALPLDVSDLDESVWLVVYDEDQAAAIEAHPGYLGDCRVKQSEINEARDEKDLDESAKTKSFETRITASISAKGKSEINMARFLKPSKRYRYYELGKTFAGHSIVINDIPETEYDEIETIEIEKKNESKTKSGK